MSGSLSPHPRKGARTVAALALFGCGLLAALWASAPRSTRERDAAPAIAVASADAPSAAELASARGAEPSEARAASTAAEPLVVAPEAAPRAQTAREFLAGYYGNEWPALEARIEAQGQVLDIPYVFTPWEEVAGEFESRVGNTPEARGKLVKSWVSWSQPLTPEFLAESFRRPEPNGFDASDVAAIEAIAAAPNTRLLERAEFLADLIDAEARRKWDTGQYAKAPFTTAGLDTRRGFFAQSTGGHGWAVSIVLTHEEYPEFAAIQETIHELRDERDVAVAEYLRGKYGR